jgi:phage gp29-like protein
MEIDFVDAGNKTASVDIYARLTEYFDKQTSKIVLGQTLSTNTGGADGGGAYALGKVHNEVREDILDADVQQLEATLAATTSSRWWTSIWACSRLIRPSSCGSTSLRT